MVCPRCGKEIRGKALFCPHCGIYLAGYQIPTPPANPPSPAKPAPPPAKAPQPGQRPAVRPTPRPAPPPHATPPQRSGWGLTILVLILGLLAFATLAVLGALAIRQGRQQHGQSEQSAVDQHYRRGLDYMRQGDYDGAVVEIQTALLIDPTNTALQTRLNEAVATRVQAAITPTPQPTPSPTVQNPAPLFKAVSDAYARGDWQAVLSSVDTLTALDATYKQAEVAEMLFAAYHNIGLQLIRDDRLEEAVRSFDRALILRPGDPEVSRLREATRLYLSAMGYWEADWARAITAMQALYALDPTFKDSRQRLHDAYVGDAEFRADQGDWCGAEKDYALALSLLSTAPVLASRQAAVRVACTTVVTPTLDPLAGIPSGTFAGRIAEQKGISENQMFIRGRVLDALGKGVVGRPVQIKAFTWSATAVTDGEGRFSFDGLANPVTYTLTLLDLPCIPYDVAGKWGTLTSVELQQAK